MNCHKCNAPLRPGAKFCVSCGTPVIKPEEHTQPVEPAMDQAATPEPNNGIPPQHNNYGMDPAARQAGEPEYRIPDNGPVRQPAQNPMQQHSGQPYQPQPQMMRQDASANQMPPQNFPNGPVQGYPYGTPYIPEKKRSGAKALIIGGIVLAVLIVGAGLFWFLSSSNDKSRTWDDDNYEYVEESAEPEFSDTKPSEQSSNAPYDYTAMVCFRELTPADLAGCPKEELRLMRNTIYARHGYTFQSRDLQEYFAQFDWYVPTTTVVPEYDMSATELKNISLIKKYE